MKKRGLFQSRKASVEEYLMFLLGEILVSLIVAFFLFSYVQSVRENTVLEKNYISRDLALIMDAMQAAPGNVYYNYQFSKLDLNKFKFSFQNQRIGVSDENQEYAISFPYSDSLFLGVLSSQIQDASTLGLMKNGDSFQVNAVMIPKLNQMSCPRLDTHADPSNKDALIDPGHGGDDFGVVNPAKPAEKESKLSLKVAEAMRDLDSELSRTLTRSDDSKLEQDPRVALVKPETDIVVSIHSNLNEKAINQLKVYVPINQNQLRSTKLACLIINQISDLGFTSYSIIPSDEELISKSPAAVMIELGNIQHSSKPVGDLGKGILRGVEKYYD